MNVQICSKLPESLEKTEPFLVSSFCRTNRTAVSVKREGKYLNKGGSFSSVSLLGFLELRNTQ